MTTMNATNAPTATPMITATGRDSAEEPTENQPPLSPSVMRMAQVNRGAREHIEGTVQVSAAVEMAQHFHRHLLWLSPADKQFAVQLHAHVAYLIDLFLSILSTGQGRERHGVVCGFHYPT